MNVERWDIFEIALEGPQAGNPFLDVTFGAVFSHGHREIQVDGFYDGEGVYRVRFMPDTEGEWHYATRSSAAALDEQTGSFVCTPPTGDNHGPVEVFNRFHFAYADGTPYRQVGTTCYAWAHQGDALEQQTLETLRGAPFNKMRMCIFPKDYAFNQNEPEFYPFARLDDGSWDFERFDPAFFRHFEGRVDDLRQLGIEADLILFHPYDRWGFATMPAEVDDRYLRYVVARLAVYRNVWWSFANEFDFMREKTTADWDRYFRVVQASDPYQRLRSIHNGHVFYDHLKPWVTHLSIQRWELDKIPEWREHYGKPVIIDESGYEGNIPQGWGGLTAQEMTRRFWDAFIRGGYAGHGETYLHDTDVLWWSKGGVLHGESPARIAFFKQILEDSPAEGLAPLPSGSVNPGWRTTGGYEDEYYISYTGLNQAGVMRFDLPEGKRYHADIIDTWDMTITPVDEVLEGSASVKTPTKPYIAVRLRKVGENA